MIPGEGGVCIRVGGVDDTWRGRGLYRSREGLRESE